MNNIIKIHITDGYNHTEYCIDKDTFYYGGAECLNICDLETAREFYNNFLKEWEIKEEPNHPLTGIFK